MLKIEISKKIKDLEKEEQSCHSNLRLNEIKITETISQKTIINNKKKDFDFLILKQKWFRAFGLYYPKAAIEGHNYGCLGKYGTRFDGKPIAEAWNCLIELQSENEIESFEDKLKRLDKEIEEIKNENMALVEHIGNIEKIIIQLKVTAKNCSTSMNLKANDAPSLLLMFSKSIQSESLREGQELGNDFFGNSFQKIQESLSELYKERRELEIKLNEVNNNIQEGEKLLEFHREKLQN